MFEDDPWLDAGIEAEDDAAAPTPRHPWFVYAGLAPPRAAVPPANPTVATSDHPDRDP